MLRKLIITGILIQLVLPADLFSQSVSAFSGRRDSYTKELIAFMGPNLNEEQTENLDAFIVRFDSLMFTDDISVRIIDISSQLSSRYLRPVPHFDSFIRILNHFAEYKQSDDAFTNWLSGISEMAFNPGFTNDNIHKFLRNSDLMITENVLFDSGSIRWKVRDHELKFLHDTLFYVEIKDATLVCHAQKDSTEIYNVSGNYYPESQVFKGSTGLITWEKAGYERQDVYARIIDYDIDVSKSSFTADSALFLHSTYFKQPVYGILTDQAINYGSKEKSVYPRFTTYETTFKINGIYKDVNYEGGLTFEGASVKGSGSKFSPASISMLRNDTLYLKINSAEFLFSKSLINSNEVSLTLYLEEDSIFHTNLGFSYIVETRQVNLFRTNNPISQSPFFNSFHNVDMYFEYLSWNMNESKIILSRSRGASSGRALIESSSFFYADYFMQLMGIDEYHPLYRLVNFAQWYYSETFPVTEFAKWLNKPEEAVIGLCIDMANRGFVFYDRTNNEVTIKQKTKDFINFNSKKKDYDVLAIVSETKAPVDNAVLDLQTLGLTINGVKNFFLSDSQMVAIYPKNEQIVLRKNRDIYFNGVVEAGLFTIYGRDFAFSYDTFKIKLQNIDSIKIAVETGESDMKGNRMIKPVDNVIQLLTAELYIDKPDNKSGLRSYKQYPILNALTDSYIYYDKIPGLEGVYPKEDFYFKVNPFTYENIDHYTNEQMNLEGEFYGGNILKPSKQYLTIQENNSLGFNMIIPENGLEIYDGNGKLYEYLGLSSKGLSGKGKMTHLSSETVSDEFSLFPDSMLTDATTFRINEDPEGVFPQLTAEDVKIKWDIPENIWYAENASGKNFSMFDNGTILAGSLSLTPAKLMGSGVIDMSESRITSDLFSFTSNAIRADTSDYNIKSRTTSGYSFIAENANTDINFDEKSARFRLNTDSSVVMFPEIQYICTMTDFTYNMDSRILSMEQKGRAASSLIAATELLRVDRGSLEKPTFFSTNNKADTISFSSGRGNYYLDKEVIEAENINYIPIADALIQPAEGKIIITRRAQIQQLDNALIAVNNRHLIHDATVSIENTKRYSGTGIYDYVDENNDVQQINLTEINVDTLTTNARGSVSPAQKFMLSPAFSFQGDVTLNARKDHLTFNGAAGIISDCNEVRSYNIRLRSEIDPANILIPVSEKPRDMNDNLVYSGSYISADSLHVYPAFLSAQRSWADAGIVIADGYLYYDKSSSSYIISSLQKIADRNSPGNLIAFNRLDCRLTSEGVINFGAKYDLVNFASAGDVDHNIDSGKLTMNAIFGIDFHFSPEALTLMADEFRMVPTLKPVNLNSDLINRGMQDIFGTQAALRLKEEMSLFGTSRNLPKEFTYELFINEATMYWNESTSSFRSKGKIGLGYVGSQPINLYVDGYIEIQRRRAGDMIDIYLKANESTWYYFSYFRGVMMTQSANNTYNKLISDMKANDRKHPESSVRVPYSFMIAVEDRLPRFLRRMSGDDLSGEEEAAVR